MDQGKLPQVSLHELHSGSGSLDELRKLTKQGELKVTKLHTVLYHDGVQEDLNFDKEKVQVVSAAGDGIPPVDGNPPCRVPIVGGTQPGWILPNARRGAERIAVCGEGGVVVREMSLLDFHDEYVVSAAAPAAGDDAESGKVAGNVVKRWRRTLSFDPARCCERLRRRGGCAKAVSIGRWLQNQGAAWGEAAVGRPVKVRPSGWAYGERDYAEAERSDASGREAEVAGSNLAEAARVGEKRKEGGQEHLTLSSCSNYTYLTPPFMLLLCLGQFHEILVTHLILVNLLL